MESKHAVCIKFTERSDKLRGSDMMPSLLLLTSTSCALTGRREATVLQCVYHFQRASPFSTAASVCATAAALTTDL